jgi:hypothetical protein
MDAFLALAEIVDPRTLEPLSCDFNLFIRQLGRATLVSGSLHNVHDLDFWLLKERSAKRASTLFRFLFGG